MFCPKQKTRFIPTEMAAIAAAASSHLMFVLRSQPLSSSFISFLKPLLLSIPQRCFYAPTLFLRPFDISMFHRFENLSSLLPLAVSQDGEETEIADDELETQRSDFENLSSLLSF